MVFYERSQLLLHDRPLARQSGTSEFFTEEFNGVLITDFWAAYQSVCAEDREYCLVPLLRELERVDDHNDSVEWRAFAKKLRRLLRDGIRLRKRDDFAPDKYRDRAEQLNKRLAGLAAEECVDGDTRRLRIAFASTRSTSSCFSITTTFHSRTTQQAGLTGSRNAGYARP